MLAEALDLLFEAIYEENSAIIAEVTTISGSSAPATVFLNRPVSEIQLNPSIPLTDQLREFYSYRHSPIARDQSAENAADLIKEKFSSSRPIRDITGIPMTSHTGAAQIKKLSDEQPTIWEQTRSVHTSGSFLCSLLIGKDAPIDLTDSSQLGLLDIKSRKWYSEIVEFVAPNLQEKLPQLVEPPRSAGFISDYFKLKYGFSDQTRCLAWISEEAAHCLGTGNLVQGEASLVLDETYSLNISIKTIPSEVPNACKVTIHPLQGYIAHIYLENGLTPLIHTAKRLNISHEAIDSHLDVIHSVADEIHLPFLQKESALGIPNVNFDKANILSVINGQLLHLKLFSQWIEQPMHSIIITGEAAKLESIGQLCSNIYQTPSYSIRSINIPTIGATILEEIFLDTPFKEIKNKYHTEVFSKCKLPEPYMANVYNISLNKYHQILTEHLSN